MEPTAWIAIAAWGSFVAALSSAGVALMTYRERQREARRADLFGALAREIRPQAGNNLAEVPLRIWNEGPGKATEITISIYPTEVPAFGTQEISMEHSGLPAALEAGDEIFVRAEVLLPQTIQTLKITWREQATRGTRRRYVALSAG